jgi:hypothetical protein
MRPVTADPGDAVVRDKILLHRRCPSIWIPAGPLVSRCRCDGPGRLRSVADRSGEHQRRAEAAWHRAEQLGAVLGVGRTIQVGDEVVEVVATLADATQTVVVYRAPVGSDLFPSPVDPPGGASGGTMGDLLVAHLPPAEGSTVLVNFGDFDDDGHEVELPIDRARTQPHERQAVRLPPPLMDDGARVAIRGAVTGLLMATIDLEVSSEDPALTAAGLGTHGSLPQPHRRAGSGALWRDWFPPPSPCGPGPSPTTARRRDARTRPSPPGRCRYGSQLAPPPRPG